MPFVEVGVSDHLFNHIPAAINTVCERLRIMHYGISSKPLDEYESIGLSVCLNRSKPDRKSGPNCLLDQSSCSIGSNYAKTTSQSAQKN